MAEVTVDFNPGDLVYVICGRSQYIVGPIAIRAINIINASSNNVQYLINFSYLAGTRTISPTDVFATYAEAETELALRVGY